MKTLGIVIAILAVLALMPLVFAEENDTTQTNDSNEPVVIAPPEDETTEEAENLNESDVGGFKLLVQELKVMFASNQEKKAHLELELARLRLIQAKIAAKHNNTAAMEKAIEAHNQIMERVKARIDSISNKGGNLTGLERAIQVHERRIELLNEVLAKVNLTEEERAKVEARLGHVENVTEKLRLLQEKLQNRTVKNETEEEEGLGENETEEECIDSDGGINYSVMGSANPCPCYGDDCPVCGAWVDKCLNETTLLEYSCDNLNGAEYSCPNGCKDGACISNSTTNSNCGATGCTSCGCGKK